MPETHFDEGIAKRHELLWPEIFEPAVVEPAVDVLAELARASRSATPRTARVDETFTLAYLVCNTVANPTTEDEQVACYRNVAAPLKPGGTFVIKN